MRLLEKLAVSIPHRYGKNLFVEARGFTVLPKVSIPHRYGKNEIVLALYDCRHWFPFLIGTVRTNTGDYRLSTYKYKFPFLIGTVRTPV